MAVRMVFTLILLLAVLFLPFWVSLVLAVVGMIFFGYFVEGIILLLFSDLLFSVPLARYEGNVFLSLLGATFLFVLIEFLKGRSLLNTNL